MEGASLAGRLTRSAKPESFMLITKMSLCCVSSFRISARSSLDDGAELVQNTSVHWRRRSNAPAISDCYLSLTMAALPSVSAEVVAAEEVVAVAAVVAADDDVSRGVRRLVAPAYC